ncbi:hypothetical protein O3M35_011791 [Rhynocoris fuscipes]|uniref:Methyltransferase type 12 domain-containing protein n=1 Tax=Rhynocoris fuscipes TaxID=488301 RepID=A0AAW1D218_9HEMI
MYEDPNLYSEHSKDHQKEAKYMLDAYSDYLKWNKYETVLDIGCGSGDVTNNVIKPYLDPSFKALVAVDKSEKMIRFNETKWPFDPRVHYHVLDISEPCSIQTLPDNLQQYDKIFSFFCLQWIRNRRAAAESMFKLLKPGGEGFLLVVVHSGIYIVFDTIAKSPKWKQFFQGYKLPFNEYVYMDEPDEVFCKALRSNGLIVKKSALEMRKNVFTTRTLTDEEMMSRIRTVDPLICSVPEDLKEEYLKEVLKLTKELVSPRGATDYHALTVIIEKPL